MNKSDNPQTDDMKFNMYSEEGEILCEVVKASFCADIEVHRDQLIRELAELNSSLESEKITRNHVIQKGAELERELNEQVVCNGKGAEREADLLGKVDRLERDNARLREALSVLISAGELLADECADQNRCEAWDEQRDTVNQLLSGAASA